MDNSYWYIVKMWRVRIVREMGRERRFLASTQANAPKDCQTVMVEQWNCWNGALESYLSFRKRFQCIYARVIDSHEE